MWGKLIEYVCMYVCMYVCIQPPSNTLLVDSFCVPYTPRKICLLLYMILLTYHQPHCLLLLTSHLMTHPPSLLSPYTSFSYPPTHRLISSLTLLSPALLQSKPVCAKCICGHSRPQVSLGSLLCLEVRFVRQKIMFDSSDLHFRVRNYIEIIGIDCEAGNVSS